MGQLGNGNKVDRPTALAVPGLTDVVAISAGDWHTCAVRSNNTAVCWGSGSAGQLGNGLNTESLSPTPVLGLSGVLAITAFGSTTCALVSGGTVYCWGDDLRGELGNGSPTSASLTPVQAAGLANVTMIDQNSARRSDGTLWFWGENEYGQAGTGATPTGAPAAIEYYSPTQVLAVSTAINISRAGVASCAAMADGTARCWGTNSNGVLGIVTTDNSFVPVQVSGLTTVSTLDCGNGHCCAIKTDGQLMCWGNNNYGQVTGDGTTTSQYAPVPGPVAY
jgi:alpha-tubulin suppressor-like RCC1 family protein